MTPQLQRALAGLNEPQREAVLHFSSPLLILAGAGSGKTRVITVKIAYLIDELGVDPRSILAVTFTNKAAGEMRTRAAALVDRAAEVTIRTFHSFGAWLLRRNADQLSLSREFSIYDEDDSITLLRTLYPEQDRRAAASIATRISRAKDYCLRPDDPLEDISSESDFASQYARYQSRIQEIGNVDFGDLIMRPVELLEQNSVVAARTRERFQYVLVDEYQDSNVAQFRLLHALSGPETFLCVVGDDDQSIYRFRGAEVRNILTFPQTFEATRVVRLEQNYRSTAPILALAGAVVAQNSGRLGKELFTTRAGGSKPRVVLFGDQDEEVAFVLGRVRDFERRGTGEIAILYRTNAQSRPFETAFLREGIAYRIVGSVRFYEREEIKDVLAVLKFLANPRDEVGLRRIINKPARGLGPKAVAVFMEAAQHTGGDLRIALQEARAALPKKAGEGITQFLKILSGIEATFVPETTPSIAAAAAAAEVRRADTSLADVVERVIIESGLAEYHRELDRLSGSQKHQNLDELVNAAGLYPATRGGLVEFLEAIELDSRREDGTDEHARVVLITMHNTKGLEFDHVIITGLEDGLFPRFHAPDEIEEERRLFYVAVTRAREELDITSCRYRRVHGRLADYLPSRFLSEIPVELVELDRRPGGVSPTATSDDPHLWQRGTTVYHDEYGPGVVTKSWYSGDEPCIAVRFQGGATMQFLPRYSSIERVAEDFA